MKKIIFSVVMILFIGTFVLFTSCEKKSTVVIKNDFPQKFVDVQGELMSNAEFNINEAIIIDEVENDSVEINLKGEMVERSLLSDLMFCGYELDYKVYNSSGKEIEENSIEKKHTINFRCNMHGEIDHNAVIYLGSEPDDYTIEFLESNYE